ncbi:MAG: hypothetical protein U0167_15300 [bacterium]
MSSEPRLLPPVPGLWVPPGYARAPARPGSGSAEFLAVALTYSDVYGTTPTWTDVERALAPYSIERIVDVASRLSIGLMAGEPPWDGDIQLTLCRGVFAPTTFGDVARALNKLQTDHKAAGRLVPLLAINEQQVLDLIKAAFLLKDLHDEDQGGSADGIGRALLMLGDLTAGQPGNVMAAEQDAPGFSDAWLAYTVANSMFTSSTLDYRNMARSYELYLTAHEELRGHPAYVNLPERLHAACGLTPEIFWSALFALASKWSTIKLSELSTVALPVNRSTYFSSHFTFDHEDAQRFVSLCCGDAADFQTAVRAHYSTDSMKPFHTLPFAQTPLVAFENRVRPLSLRLLGDTLCTGLHHRYLNPAVFSSEERQRYLEFAGLVFEDYVHRTIERIYPPASGRYIRTRDLRPQLPGKNCDGLLVYGRAVVLVEAKASLLSAEARAGADVAAVRGRLGDILVDAAGQFRETIAALQGGFRDESGLLPKQIDRYYPLVVTLEDLAMTPLLHREFLGAEDVAGPPGGGAVAPLQSMSVRDLERVEVMIDRGAATLLGLLEKKVGSAVEQEDSWKNFLYRRRQLVPEGAKHEYLHTLFARIADQTKSYFRSNAREPSDAPTSSAPRSLPPPS